MPAEVRSAVEPYIDHWLHLLPTWVHELAIKYDPENGNSALMGSQPQYRIAHLTITGWFLKADDDDRESTIVHEFLHAPLHPLTDWTKDLIERLTGDDERLADWLRSEWQERLEAATCDLEKAVQRTAARSDLVGLGGLEGPQREKRPA